MNKKILILAKSIKGTGYCVAGIDVENQKFVRLVATENSATNEIPIQYMTYENKEVVECLDIIEITIKKHIPTKHQPENDLVDLFVAPKLIKKITVNEIYDFLSNDDYIYLNNNNVLNDDDITKLSSSIKLFKIDNLKIYKNDYNQLKAYFFHNDNLYKNVTITDSSQLIQIEKIYKNAIIVVTIPENPSQYNSLYYKIIAKIFFIDK